jgi:hypothetical protein
MSSVAWVDACLSAQRRTMMLAALRRRKADATGAPCRSRMFGIPKAMPLEEGDCPSVIDQDRALASERFFNPRSS